MMKKQNTNPNMELLSELTDIIEKHNACKLNYDITFQTVLLHNQNYETEFRYCIFAEKIIVSRICFAKRHNGCMTDCFETLKQFAEIHDCKEIQIQSVLTYGMQQWCLKHHFVPDVCNMLITDEQNRNVITGDYHFTIH